MDLNVNVKLTVSHDAGNEDGLRRDLADLGQDLDAWGELLLHMLTLAPDRPERPERPDRFDPFLEEPPRRDWERGGLTADRLARRLADMHCFSYQHVLSAPHAGGTILLGIAAVKPDAPHRQFAQMGGTVALALPKPDGGCAFACLPVEVAKQLVNRIGDAISVLEGAQTRQDGAGRTETP